MRRTVWLPVGVKARMHEVLARMRFRRDHRWAPDRMSDYLDGELGPRRRARIEYHVGECVECRRLITGLTLLLEALHRVPALQVIDAAHIAASVRARQGGPAAT